jgi:hypothetical protein
VRDKWPRQFKSWVLKVCASVGGGAVPAPAGGASGGSSPFFHLLTRAEELAVLDWPPWPQAPVGKASAYLKVGAPARRAARGLGLSTALVCLRARRLGNGCQ